MPPEMNAITCFNTNQFPVHGLCVDISKSESSFQLYALFSNEGRHGMLDGRYYLDIYILFPYISGYVDRSTRFGKETQLTDMILLYSEGAGDPWSNRRLNGIKDECIAFLIRSFMSWKIVL